MTGTIAVIGGSGFLGQVLVDQLLADGADVRIVDLVRNERHAGRTVIADMRDPRALRTALEGVRSVYNLAAEWRDDVRPAQRYYETNVGGAESFCETATTLGIRECVFTSSVSVYGTSEVELAEDGAKRPFNAYGQSKLAAEAVFRDWASADPAISLRIVRPTVIFGPGNRGNVYNLLAQIGRPWFVMVGSGENRKSIAYVDNVAAFLRQVADGQPGIATYNYADKPDYSMSELVALVEAQLGRRRQVPLYVPYRAALMIGAVFDRVSLLTGRRFAISAERVFKFCANTRYSAEAARATGFIPPVPVDEALRRTIRADFAG